MHAHAHTPFYQPQLASCHLEIRNFDVKFPGRMPFLTLTSRNTFSASTIVPEGQGMSQSPYTWWKCPHVLYTIINANWQCSSTTSIYIEAADQFLVIGLQTVKASRLYTLMCWNNTTSWYHAKPCSETDLQDWQHARHHLTEFVQEWATGRASGL